MLIAEIIRIYDVFDGKTATKKTRETGATEGKRLKIDSSHASILNY